MRGFTGGKKPNYREIRGSEKMKNVRFHQAEIPFFFFMIALSDVPDSFVLGYTAPRANATPSTPLLDRQHFPSPPSPPPSTQHKQPVCANSEHPADR